MIGAHFTAIVGVFFAHPNLSEKFLMDVAEAEAGDFFERTINGVVLIVV